MNGPIPNRWSPYLLSVLRIVAAFTFISHGTQKLFAFPALEPRTPVPLLSLLGLAGALELVGGALLLVGLFTRPVAFLLAGEMAFAYFMAHASRSFWPVLNGGEVVVLFCFVLASPMLTMPCSRPSSTTGRWRTRWRVVSAISRVTLSSGRQL